MIRAYTVPVLAFALGCLLVLPVMAAPMPQEGGGGEGGPAAARISYLDGTVYCWGPFDSEKRNLMINDLVREGDEIYAAPGTYVEVELPGATYLRLDGGSSVVVRAYHDDLRLVPSAGSFYLSTGDWTEAQLQFGPDGAEVASASLARVSISPDQHRNLAVVYGLGRVINHEATMEVADNQQISALNDAAPWTSAEFYPQDEAAFDIWSLEREEHLRGVPQEDSPSYPLVGYSDLQEHGNWVAVDGVHCWRPRYVDVDWRPYTVGEWTWYADYGWVWVSGYTWGYVTYHHGRWSFDPFYGWVWMPGMVWSPAWVSWAVFDGYVAWAPIGWWGWPVVAAAHWHSYWHHRCWTFAHYDYFYHGGYHHHGSYHYGNYHHHHQYSHNHHNSHHRSSSSHHSAHNSHGNHGGASASNSRDDASASNARGVADSNDRGNLGQSFAGQKSAGSGFRTFEQGEFEAMDRATVKDANRDLLQASNMTAQDRASFERGGDDRMAVMDRQHTFDRGSRGAADRGTAGGGRGQEGFSGGSDRGSGSGSGSGHSAVDRGQGGQGRNVVRPDGNGSFTPSQPTDRTHATDQRSVQQRARDSLGQSGASQRQVSPSPERRETPAVPQYSGRSDSRRQFEPPQDNNQRSSSQWSGGSSSSSSNRQSGSRTSTSSNSSNRSRQSGSTRSSSSSSSSSSSKKSNSGSRSRGSSSKKKKK